ncbi:MAG: putative esterase [Herminiimonas sp.]|nr:putative esterase [Herminiimonas sp.]
MKTYVLVHGAWHGAWCWRDVASGLRQAGHRVFTPTQTGSGERAHLLSRDITLDCYVRDVVDLLKAEDLSDVVLVGHSFGGISISGAADRVPHRIRHLVYLDALILNDGQSAFSMIPANVVAVRRALATASGGVSIPVPDPAAFGVTVPEQAAWLRKECTPQALSTYEDVFRLKGEVGNGLPATYVAVTPHYVPTTGSRDYARARQDWRYAELEAGHDAMVTTPGALIEILLEV